MWGPIQQELALQGWRSYAIDLPGHGAQARYPVSYQAPQDLEAFAAEAIRGFVAPFVQLRIARAGQ